MLQFLSTLRKMVLLQNLPVQIDFRAMSLMQPQAALLLSAEIDRIIRYKSGTQAITCTLPRSLMHRQLLQQLGLLERLGHHSNDLLPEDYPDNVRHWRFATGQRVGEQAGSFLDDYEGRIAPAIAQGVWKALSEALVNTVQHAYLLPRGDGCPSLDEKRWWMLTQERDGQLTVAVCDLGIGFRRSLPLNWSSLTMEEIFETIRDPEQDLAAIRASLILGSTRTGETNRGRGLPQIWNSMKLEDVGGMAIMSGKGYLRYAAANGQEHGGQYADSIMGTLIMWTVALKAEPEENE